MASGIGGGRIRNNKVNPKGRCKVENGCEDQYNGDETLGDAGDFFDAGLALFAARSPAAATVAVSCVYRDLCLCVCVCVTYVSDVRR